MYMATNRATNGAQKSNGLRGRGRPERAPRAGRDGAAAAGRRPVARTEGEAWVTNGVLTVVRPAGRRVNGGATACTC
ncbi:hypothetical protein Slala03_79950 [Streptomyces lavendulae subsp. lavendulae]|nr:hypothetical protein Slala03_79950 [Streptomyces lavendulae subsp. lavendulae]